MLFYIQTFYTEKESFPDNDEYSRISQLLCKLLGQINAMLALY